MFRKELRELDRERMEKPIIWLYDEEVGNASSRKVLRNVYYGMMKEGASYCERKQ